MATNYDKSDDSNIPYWKNQKPPTIRGQRFYDPLFPPNIKSLLGLDSNFDPIDQNAYDKNDTVFPDEIEFKKPSEIFGDQNYDLFFNKIEIDDIIQGKLGDCYFLAAVSNLCRFSELILNLFKTKELNEDGYYEIIFYIDGIKQIVIIDDYIPVNKNTNWPIFAKPHKNKIWVMLLEKAWAKVNGGYSNANYGWPSDAFEFLVGYGSTIFNLFKINKEDLAEYKIEVIKNVQISNINNFFISCSTYNNEYIKQFGLVKNHAYTLVDFNKIITRYGKIVHLFKLRNPHSKGEWNGDWSDSSPLWDEKTKKQVKYNNKEDGIFFINDIDFFEYFDRVEICNVFYNEKSITYSIEGEENLRNGIVFNIIVKEPGILNVTVPRKNWRAYREIKNKSLPTHISIVKYDPNQKNKLKIFSNYIGTYNSYETCAINTNVKKGNYLIYVYRDYDHAEFKTDKILKVKITCTSEFKHAQMSYDERDEGFPLLQNIILQAEFIENKYDPDKCEAFFLRSTQIRGNGIGHAIYYNPEPDYFLRVQATTTKIKNYIMLSPYINEQKPFTQYISSSKYLVLLGLKIENSDNYSFDFFQVSTTIGSKENYFNNDIDLNIYIDINNDINNIKNKDLKGRKEQNIERTKTLFYFDNPNEEVIYSNLSDLTIQCGDLINLLDDVNYNYDNTNLKWGVIIGEYAKYIGQFNENGLKQGKGLLINPRNIFAGSFYNNQRHGKGCIYNNKKEKIYYCNYKNGKRIGKYITLEEEKINRENELEKENKKFEEEEKKRKQLLENINKEQKEEEEKIKEEIERIDQAYIAKLEKKEKFDEEFDKQLQKRILDIIKQIDEKNEEKKKLEEEKINNEKKEKFDEEFDKQLQKRILDIIKQTEEKNEEKKKIEEEKIIAEEQSKKNINLEKEELEKKKLELNEKKNNFNKLMTIKTMKIKNEEEEAKKQREINIENLNNLKKEIEEKNKKEEELENDNENLGIFGIEEYNLELENSSKRRKNLDIPYEANSKEVVTCGCNIF